MANDIFTRSTAFATRWCALAILGASFVVVATVPAQAQIARSWDAGDGNWSAGTNWAPIGVPGPLDGAFIGNLPAVENSTVTLDQSDTVASVQITDGMTLRESIFGTNSLTVNGDTLISGENKVGDDFFQSKLVVPAGGYSTDNLTVENGADLLASPGSVLNVFGTLSIDESSRLAETVDFSGNDATINLFKASGIAMVNDGVIAPILGGLVINQNSGGTIDLDGTTGNGNVFLTNHSSSEGLSDRLTIHGSQLGDSFSGSIIMRNEALIDMDLSSGWTADSRSQITILDMPSVDLGPAELRGADVVLGGTIDIEPGGWLEVSANATVMSTATVTITSENTDYSHLEFEGTTIVNGGTFTLVEGSNLNFFGPTTVSGGTFNTASAFLPDRDVNFFGHTTYSGNMTINGLAQQEGDATVSDASIISGDAFDMDGSFLEDSVWDISASLDVNVAWIDAGTRTFSGTFNISGPVAARLAINLTDPQASWQMAGTMNLTGTPFGFANRVAGSRMVVTGQLNVQQRADISADTTLSATSTTDIIASAHLLRMSGVTVVEPGATIMGDGYLQNAASGDMSLPAGLSTGNVGLSNEGLLRLGDAVGVVAVAEFVQSAGATLVADVGRNTTSTDSDVLTISNSAALVAGFVQPNIVNIGGTFQPPQIGDTFTILTAVGGVIDTFGDVLDSNLGGQVYEWTLIHNPNNVQIELTDIGGLPGDYNLNGVVDAPDYVIWRKLFGSQTNLAADGDLSGTVDQADYDFWVARFGNTLGTGSAASHDLGVPEPASALLLILRGIAVFLRERRIALGVPTTRQV